MFKNLIFVVNQEYDICSVMTLFYHLYLLDLAIDLLDTFSELFCDFFGKNYTLIIDFDQPSLSRFAVLFFIYSRFYPKNSTDFFITLYYCDARDFGNVHRANAVSFRALGELSGEQLLGIKFQNPPEELSYLIKSIENLQAVQRFLMEPNLSLENESELLFKKAQLFLPSPDVSILTLVELANFNSTHGYHTEEIQVLLCIATMIVDYSTLAGRMKDIWSMIHSGSIFSRISPSIEYFLVPTKLLGEFPQIPSFCDSDFFNFRRFADIVYQIVQKSFRYQLFEIGYECIDILWPLLESFRSFPTLKELFLNYSSLSEELSNILVQSNRNFGKFYLVSFSGLFFKEDNDQSFIYHENDNVSIEDLSNRLFKQFQTEECFLKILPPESEFEKSYAPSLCFIRIRQVFPSFSPEDLPYRLTFYDHNSKVIEFYYDNFHSNEESSMDNRTVSRIKYRVQQAFPSVVHRIAADEISDDTYELIHYHYKNLKEANIILKNAMFGNDFSFIGRILKTHLMDDLANSPFAMVETYVLSQEFQNKYVEKIEQEFENYTKLVPKLLTAHAIHSMGSPILSELNNLLEEAYQNLFTHYQNKYHSRE